MHITFLSEVLYPDSILSSDCFDAAEDCEVAVIATESIAYDTRSIKVPSSCETFTVNFEHKGSLPKTVMGHNWVLTKNDDLNEVVKAGSAAGIAQNLSTRR